LADGGFRAADPRLDQRLQRQSDVAGSRSRELKLLASIVELGNDAITDDGIITNWNKAAEQLFGVCEVCSHLEDQGEGNAVLDRIQGGHCIERDETVRARKDGGLIDLAVTISPVRDAEGIIVGASAIARDVTERKRSETQISVLARSKNLLVEPQSDLLMV
jgi:PAS domain S-box-containing protein